MAIRMAMIAITTNNSIKVKALAFMRILPFRSKMPQKGH
jgi:hypothetical protein